MLGYTRDKHSNVVNALAPDMKAPGLRASPGRRFPARVRRAGPAFQRPPRIENLPAVLFDDARGDPWASNPLGLDARPWGPFWSAPIRCWSTSSSSSGTLSLLVLGNEISGL
eukprot:1868054-Pyramimonas_sp.AAC.1